MSIIKSSSSIEAFDRAERARRAPPRIDQPRAEVLKAKAAAGPRREKSMLMRPRGRDKLGLEREALPPDLAERFHTFESVPENARRMFLRETGDHVIKPHLDGLTKIRLEWLVRCLTTTGLVAGSASAAYIVMRWVNGFFAQGLSELWIACSVAAGLAAWFVLWLKPWINDTDLEAD